MTRLVAVLGYSTRGGDGLDEICLARLHRAEAVARPGDVVLLSGWARRGSPASEAEQMAQAWDGPPVRLELDRRAHSTRANVLGAARLARALHADEVVLVTSPWHARRASALLRRALRGGDMRITVATTDERGSPAARLRELACWTVVPLAVRRG
jgi:uncharacterized SAM-binding protein YcdF (DUF218 family)